MSNSSIVPSAMDLLLVLPRLAHRAGDAVDNIASRIFGTGTVIADATGAKALNATITKAGGFWAATSAAAITSAVTEAWEEAPGEETMSGALLFGLMKGVKSFGGIFSYLTSRWALTTFTVAILLNRTQFYASSREHLRLRWHMRLALYSIPTAAFLQQTLIILQAMCCQTSPEFSLHRYSDPNKFLAIDFGGDGGFLYDLSSTLLFWQDDAASCAARNMSLSSVGNDKAALRGSLSLLYWFFITICIGQLFETLICALQGKQPMPETGMTIFEHSLAFAECEAMLSSALGFGFFGLTKGEAAGNDSSTDAAVALLARADILPRLNVPPEVLLVCLISCFSNMSSALLAITNIRHKVRLLNTAIWALCYMAAFIWSFAKVFFTYDELIADHGVLRFPTVCMVGFIPHMLILVGIFTCAVIYGIAIIITAMSVPPGAVEGLSFKQRIYWAYNNLQANVQFSTNSAIRIRMAEDFYTTLLKVGFNVLTAASEAVYLNEGSRIQVAQMTWLEQKRIDELASDVEQRQRPAIPSELLGGNIARGVGFIDQQNAAISQSPYARERKSRPTQRTGERANPAEIDTGLGLAQRRSRMQLTGDFITGVIWLIISVQARFVLGALRTVGIDYRPAWLLKAAGLGDGQGKSQPAHLAPRQDDSLEFHLIGADGSLKLPADTEVDVETEMRERQRRAGTYQDEDRFGESIYGWWRQGGWFGDVDTSGDYEDQAIDDDLTSVISMSTNAEDDSWEDEEEDGRRTPTQDDFQSGSREGTPADEGIDLSTLSRLLDPRTPADRDEARLLAQRLSSNRPMTRSQYRRSINRGRAELLAGLRKPANPHSPHISEEEEERDLESFLLQQRATAKAKARTSGGTSWETGGDGLGDGGPQCVVCQSAPRTILVWPCGCLSMCDDCRVGLAARNYTKCICCRTDIAAYSRLFVP